MAAPAGEIKRSLVDQGRPRATRTPQPVKTLKTILIYVWAPVANLLWYVYTVVMATISLAVHFFDRTGAMQHWCARWWCRLIAWSIFSWIRVHGIENVSP